MDVGSLLQNRYRITEVLGQGGMGAVYRAIDENLGVEIAIKENLFTTDEYSRQFRREAVILATLKHPNLPRVSDHFEVPDQGQYLVMDYIEGEDLRQRMDRAGILPEKEVIVIGVAVCDALGFLHSRTPPIIHRDIKPGNIKISPDGHIYLVDFGLAKIMKDSRATTTGARAMTPGYSSPEQYGTARTDARSDVYSLGAMLYAACTGTVPEDGLARAMEQVDLTPCRRRNPRISRRLASVIEKSLEIHPEDRYQTAEAFQKALASAGNISRKKLESKELTVSSPTPEEIEARKNENQDSPTKEPISDPKMNFFGESEKRKRRKKYQRYIRITLFTTFAVVALIVLTYVFISGNSPDEPSDQTPIAALVESPTLTPTIVPINETPIPESTEALVVDETEIPTITTTFTQTPSATPVPPTTTPSPTATEDLRLPTPYGGGTGEIAFVSNRSGSPQIWLMNADGSNKHQISNIPLGACQPEWSPDGTQIAYVSPCTTNLLIYYETSIYIMNADGTNSMRLPLELGSFDPAWSPDGSKLLFTRAVDDIRAKIYMYEFETEEVSLLIDNDKLNMNPVWSPDGDKFAYVSSVRAGRRIWIMEPDPEAIPIFFQEGSTGANISPEWSPNGDYMAFSQEYGENKILRLAYAVFYNPEEGEYRERWLLEGSVFPQNEPDISPDGSLVIFEGWPDGENHDVFIVLWGGTVDDIIALTTDPAEDYDAVWRPTLNTP